MTHDDLNDSLDDLLGRGPAPERKAPVAVTPVSRQESLGRAVERARASYFDQCPKCNGTGQTRWGVCFRCQGKGGRSFKTSATTRATARTNTAVRKQAARDQFRADYAAEVAWLAAAAERQHENAHKGRKVWDFPIALDEALAKYGSLTDGQLEAVRRCMAKDAERAQARAQETATRDASAPACDVSKLEAAFAMARAKRKSEKWPVLLLSTFRFVDAPAGNGFDAAILVREGNDKLGRIANGRYIAGRGVDEATQARVLECIADPAAAARAYGLETGICSCCGAELTNEESKRLGIGPICRAKWGF